MFIPSVGNNFPPVGSAPAEGTKYAAANFNPSIVPGKFSVANRIISF